MPISFPLPRSRTGSSKRAARNSFTVTETHFQVLNQSSFLNTVEWHAMMDWLEFHELDPMMILVEQEIVRLPEENAIETEYIVKDDAGRISHIGNVVITEEKRFVNEGPPLPFPAELFEEL